MWCISYAVVKETAEMGSKIPEPRITTRSLSAHSISRLKLSVNGEKAYDFSRGLKQQCSTLYVGVGVVLAKAQ